MIATGLLTTLGALLSIVPFEAMRNLAAIWLGESSPQGWRGSPWAWAAIAVGALFVLVLARKRHLPAHFRF